MGKITFSGSFDVEVPQKHIRESTGLHSLNSFIKEKKCLKNPDNLVTLTKPWRRDRVVITTAQLHSTNPKLRFCAGSDPAQDVSKVRNGDLWQWSRLEIRLNAFRRSTASQKQFFIIIIIIIINHSSIHLLEVFKIKRRFSDCHCLKQSSEKDSPYRLQEHPRWHCQSRIEWVS